MLSPARRYLNILGTPSDEAKMIYVMEEYLSGEYVLDGGQKKSRPEGRP